MNEMLAIVLMIGLVVFLCFALKPTPRSPWQDSMQGGMHMKGCGNCAAGRPCRTRDSWEAQR